MKLDKFTFGKSPAALYLTLLLNERGDRKLKQKVSSFIQNRRTFLNEVVATHHLSDTLSVASFSTILNLILTDIRSSASHIGDTQVENLIVNILRGEINFHRKRTWHAVRLNNKLAKGAKEGAAPPTVKATPYRNEESLEDKNERLVKRSAAYLARHGKPNTLY